MGFLELAKKRCSIRSFSSRMPEQDQLDLILEAGRIAPTAANFQPQRIFVLQGEGALEKVKHCTPFHFNAPVILLICYDKNESWKRKYDGEDGGAIDAAIVITHMMLQAEELGLGTTWVGSFDPAAVVREFALPKHLIPVALLPLGYPAEGAGPSPKHYERKELGETVVYWNQ